MQSTSWLNTEQLDHELVRRGLTLTEFAKASGVNLETLSRLRGRHTRMTAGMQKRIASALAAIPLADHADLVARQAADRG